MLYFILGPDFTLTRSALRDLIASLDPTGNDTTRIDGATATYDQAFAAVAAAPFFGGRRVIVISDLMARVQPSPSGSKRSAGRSAGWKFEEFFGSIPGTTDLIIFEPSLADVPAAIRKLLPPGTTQLANQAPRGERLVDKAVEIAENLKSVIDRATARQLLERIFPVHWRQEAQNRAYDRPPSIEVLENEIAKLAAYSYPGPIQIEAIEALSTETFEERTFPLLDAVISGNRSNAVVEWFRVVKSGDDQSRISAQVFQQVELGVAATATGRPRDSVEAGRRLGLSNPNRMRPVEQAAARSRIKAQRLLELSTVGDRQLKTGQLSRPEDPVSNLVAAIAEE